VRLLLLPPTPRSRKLISNIALQNSYFAIFLCACGIFPCIGLLLPLTASMHEDDSKRGAGFLLLNLIGQCGPFLGTRLYPANEGCVPIVSRLALKKENVAD
jgi:hypothetical protein